MGFDYENEIEVFIGGIGKRGGRRHGRIGGKNWENIDEREMRRCVSEHNRDNAKK